MTVTDCASEPPYAVLDVSVVIPVRDRWHALYDTLCSLERQTRHLREIIIVDDGSLLPIPAFLHRIFENCRVHLVRQAPLGIAEARNRGMTAAQGDIILFTDSDCVLDAACILELTKCAMQHPEDPAFQLAFIPAGSHLVWHVDGISKYAKQQVLKMPSGHIMYLDTGAFAIRRSYVMQSKICFDVANIRGSDTALMQALITDGHMPRFVNRAYVEHRPTKSPLKYILRQFNAGYYSSPVRAALSACSVDVLLKTQGRIAVLRQAWRTVRLFRLGAMSFFMLFVSYVSEISGRFLFMLIGMRRGRTEVLGIPVDCLHTQELQSRILSSAARRIPICITYLTAWSLVLAQRDTTLFRAFYRFDTIYADGMGVVLSLLLLRLRRARKVTANDFFMGMCEEAARRHLRVALIGSTLEVIACTRDSIVECIPNLKVVLYSHGFLSESQQQSLINDICRKEPHLVVLGLGQPLQECLALRIRDTFPHAAVLCVGGLFDYIAGVIPTPPRVVRSCGFEWLWKLIFAPSRMWKRYVLGLPILVVYILREYLRYMRRVTRLRRKHKEF